MDPVEIMLDDLARQVAASAVAQASWKARAITAEAKLAELAEEADEEDE